MHDLDQVRLELEGEEFFESEGAYGTMDELVLTDSNGHSAAAELSDVEEMELATELLGVSTEGELDQFLGKLFKKATKVLGGPAGHALGSMLKHVARRALPIAAGAVGSWFGGPAGAAISQRLASGAGQMFGLELEGLSPQDQEYEVAKSFVRLASTAAKTLSGLGAGAAGDPFGVAKTALAAAAQKYAPGILQATGAIPALAGGVMSTVGQSGTWRRVGNTIVLYGV